jgi:hypothetical protein
MGPVPSISHSGKHLDNSVVPNVNRSGKPQIEKPMPRTSPCHAKTPDQRPSCEVRVPNVSRSGKPLSQFSRRGSKRPGPRTSAARASSEIQPNIPPEPPPITSRTSTARASLISIYSICTIRPEHQPPGQVSLLSSSSSPKNKKSLGPRRDIPNINRPGKFKQVLYALRRSGSCTVPHVNRAGRRHDYVPSVSRSGKP